MLTIGLMGKRWDIFEASVDLFSKRGYDNTSMRDIADAIGMKSGSLYNHFASKESILETMYHFYLENIENATPNLERILSLIPDRTPKEILFMTMLFFGEDLQPFMDKIYLVSVLRSTCDPRASNLVWEYNFKQADRYLRSVLLRMIELGKIEPLDIDSFIEMFCSFGFAAVFKQNIGKPLGMDNWIKGLDFLFSAVREKERTASTTPSAPE